MLGDTNSTLAAVQAASGVSAAKVSLTIRTILLVLVFVWAGYVVQSKINHFKHHGIDGLDATRKFFGVLLVVMLAWSLVYVV